MKVTIQDGQHEKVGMMRMTGSHSVLINWASGVLLLFALMWTAQALANDSEVDDEVITVPFEPRPAPSALQVHHTLRWRHVSAHSILLKELKTGATLYQFESQKKLSPASLTKIMSALVILEKGHLNDEVTVSPKAARAHKTHLRLRTGQIFRLEDLLKAMLIMSANDACLAASEHVRCLTRRHDSLKADLSDRDARKLRRCPRHYRPSPGRAPHCCRLRPDNLPR